MSKDMNMPCLHGKFDCESCDYVDTCKIKNNEYVVGLQSLTTSNQEVEEALNHELTFLEIDLQSTAHNTYVPNKRIDRIRSLIKSHIPSVSEEPRELSMEEYKELLKKVFPNGVEPQPTKEQLRDEIISELNEYYNKKTVYWKNMFWFKDADAMLGYISLDHLKRVPHIIELMGKFYKVVIDNE